MTFPKFYIVTGISGSGKTSIARELVARGEVAFDSKVTPGIYSFVDKEGNVAERVFLDDPEWRQRFKWSLNEDRLNELLANNSFAPRVFLCGRANIFQYWQRAERVLLLKIDQNTLHERLNSKTRDNLFAKDKPTQQRLLHELDAVQNKLIEKGAVAIDARASVGEIVDRIVAFV